MGIAQIQLLFGVLLSGAVLVQTKKPFAGLVILPGPETARSWPPPTPPRSKRENVPLKSVETKATVRGWAVDVHSVLTYSNSRYENIACQFVFPIPFNAAVYKFEATIGGRKLKASVKNRTEAQKIYQDAVDIGQRAGLLESQEGSPDVYRILLGNMGAGEDAVVTLAYAMPIERDPKTGTLTVNLPVVLNPRYIPEIDIKDPDIMEKKFHAIVKYIAVSHIPYKFSFSANVDLGIGGGNKIVNIKSGNSRDQFRVLTQNNNQAAKVKLISAFSRDHDFSLIIETKREFKTTVFTEPGRPVTDFSGVSTWLSYDIAGAWFEPLGKARTGLSKDQYWLLVDRSGSMKGDKITKTKSALIFFIKSLPLGSKFNIIGFGSSYDLAFSNCVDYNDVNVKKAMEYANNLDATFGGTEVLKPLRNIYNRPIPSGVEKNFIILLTDGEVSNTNRVINLARKNARETTVYSIGIGQGASTALVDGVARVSNGVSEYVRSNEDRLQAKVVGIIKITQTPTATNVNLEWSGNGFRVLDTLPKASRSEVIQGRELTQFAIFNRNTPVARGVSRLSAKFYSKSLKFKVPFTITGKSESDDPMPLHRLAAKAKLLELQDAYYSLGYYYDESLKEEAIQISEATGVKCEFTSIVAVDERGDVVKDKAGKPLFVGIERPTVYEKGIITRYSSSVNGHSASQPYEPLSTTFKVQQAGKKVGHSPVPFAIHLAPSDPRSAKVKATAIYKTGLQQLINLVSTTGAWKLNSEFSKAIRFQPSQKPDALKRALLLAVAPWYHPTDDVLATLTGVAALRFQFPYSRDNWDLIEQKAVQYLKKKRLSQKRIDEYVNRIAREMKF